MNSLEDDDLLDNQVDNYEFCDLDQAAEEALLNDDEDYQLGTETHNNSASNWEKNGDFNAEEEDVLTTSLQDDDLLELEESNGEFIQLREENNKQSSQNEIEESIADESGNQQTFNVDGNEEEEDEEEDDDDEQDARGRFKSERQMISMVSSKKVVRDIPDSLDKVSLSEESKAQLERENQFKNKFQHNKKFKGQNFKGNNRSYHQPRINNSEPRKQMGGFQNTENAMWTSFEPPKQFQPSISEPVAPAIPSKILINPKFKGPLMAENMDREFRKQQMLNRSTQSNVHSHRGVPYSGHGFSEGPSQTINHHPPRYPDVSYSMRQPIKHQPMYEEFQPTIRPLMSVGGQQPPHNVHPPERRNHMPFQNDWPRAPMNRNSYPPTNFPPPHMAPHIMPPQRPLRFESHEPFNQRPPMRFETPPPRPMRFDGPPFREPTWNEQPPLNVWRNQPAPLKNAQIYDHMMKNNRYEAPQRPHQPTPLMPRPPPPHHGNRPMHISNDLRFRHPGSFQSKKMNFHENVNVNVSSINPQAEIKRPNQDQSFANKQTFNNQQFRVLQQRKPGMKPTSNPSPIKNVVAKNVKAAPAIKKPVVQSRPDNRQQPVRTSAIKEVPMVNLEEMEKAKKAPKDDEDEATKELRKKIEQQKKIREDYLRKKEERRKQQAAQRLAELNARMGNNASNPVEGQEPSPMPQQAPALPVQPVKLNVKNRIGKRKLISTDPLAGNAKKPILIQKDTTPQQTPQNSVKKIPTVVKTVPDKNVIKIVPNQNVVRMPTGQRNLKTVKIMPPGNIARTNAVQNLRNVKTPAGNVLTKASQVVSNSKTQVQTVATGRVIRTNAASNQTAARQQKLSVVPNVNQNAKKEQSVQLNKVTNESCKALIGNLASTTSSQTLTRICSSIGPGVKIQSNPSNRTAVAIFKTPNHAKEFCQKYDRRMVDLSVIKVELMKPNSPIT